MKAIRINEYGNADVLQIEEIPTPTPGPGEALIKIKAAGLNFIDIYMRTGRYPFPLPFTPGREGAGIVEAIGPGVTEVKVGDRVAYADGVGSYAEYGVAKAAQLIPLPDDISFEIGAALPLQGMTAHYLLHDYYQIKPNDYVLVHAAAGGVGLLLVQWLKQMGAKVIGTVSTEEKATIIKEAGADHVILYTQEDFVTECKKITRDKGVDYILDGVGKTTFTKDLDAAKVHGWICLYGSASGPAEPLQPNSLQAKSLILCGGSLFNHITTHQDVIRRSEAVIKGIREGWLNFNIDHILPLNEAQQAHSLLEGRKTSGKVILKIN